MAQSCTESAATKLQTERPMLLALRAMIDRTLAAYDLSLPTSSSASAFPSASISTSASLPTTPAPPASSSVTPIPALASSPASAVAVSEKPTRGRLRRSAKRVNAGRDGEDLTNGVRAGARDRDGDVQMGI